MKLFRLLSTTAVTVLAIAALAISASAMTATYTAPTETAAGSVAISGIEYNKDAEQKTLLILNEDTTSVEADDIVQIDQAGTIASVAVGNLTADIDAANNAALATYATALATYETALETYNANQTEETYVTVSAAYATVSAAYDELTAAFAANATDTYYVRVGGAGAVDETTQKVLIDACELTVKTTVENTYAEPIAPEEPEEEPVVPDEPEYMLGDVYVDSGVDDYDALLIDYYYADMYDEAVEFFGEGCEFWEDEEGAAWLAADVYTDGGIDDYDALLIDYYYADMYDEAVEFFGEGCEFWEKW